MKKRHRELFYHPRNGMPKKNTGQDQTCSVFLIILSLFKRISYFFTTKACASGERYEEIKSYGIFDTM